LHRYAEVVLPAYYPRLEEGGTDGEAEEGSGEGRAGDGARRRGYGAELKGASSKAPRAGSPSASRPGTGAASPPRSKPGQLGATSPLRGAGATSPPRVKPSRGATAAAATASGRVRSARYLQQAGPAEEPPVETKASSSRYYLPKGAGGDGVTMAKGEDPKAQPYYFYFDVVYGPDWAQLEEFPEGREVGEPVPPWMADHAKIYWMRWEGYEPPKPKKDRSGKAKDLNIASFIDETKKEEEEKAAAAEGLNAKAKVTSGMPPPAMGEFVRAVAAMRGRTYEDHEPLHAMKGGVIRHLWQALLGIRAAVEKDMETDRARWMDELERMKRELAAEKKARAAADATAEKERQWRKEADAKCREEQALRAEAVKRAEEAEKKTAAARLARDVATADMLTAQEAEAAALEAQKEAESITRRYSIGIKLARATGHAAWLKQKEYLAQLVEAQADIERLNAELAAEKDANSLLRHRHAALNFKHLYACAKYQGTVARLEGELETASGERDFERARRL
jgi:hypothetical protein